MLNKHVKPENKTITRVRVDKWLWAARFYKTRSLANEAVKTGKITVNGERVKAGKELANGDMLHIRQGVMHKTIEVVQLSAQRGPATVAATLYRETPESVSKREKMLELLRAQPAARPHGQGRPTKRERRHIISFTTKRQY